MLPTVESAPPPRPAQPAKESRSPGWNLFLALALGLGLLRFGWSDVRAYSSVDHRQPALSFDLTSRPGGVRVGPSEFFRSLYDGYVRLENFAALSNEVTRTFRYGLGPVSTLEVVTTKARGQLAFGFHSLLPDQELTIACNGRVLERIAPLPKEDLRRSLPLDLQPGPNLITFTYARYNHDGVHEIPAEPRPLAGAFYALDLSLE